MNPTKRMTATEVHLGLARAGKAPPCPLARNTEKILKDSPPTLRTKPGDYVRVAFNAKLSDRVGAEPLTRARLSVPLRCISVWEKGVRIGGDTVSGGQWHKSWVKCSPP